LPKVRVVAKHTSFYDGQDRHCVLGLVALGTQKQALSFERAGKKPTARM
jgi:hypothetical protein